MSERSDYPIGVVADFPPGTHRVVKVRNVEIGIFNIGGEFYALSNICPHQFGPVCNGTVNGTTACNAATDWHFSWGRDGEILTCPWHGLEFDVATGQCLAPAKFRLRTYPVSVRDGEVRVRLRGGVE